MATYALSLPTRFGARMFLPGETFDDTDARYAALVAAGASFYAASNEFIAQAVEACAIARGRGANEIELALIFGSYINKYLQQFATAAASTDLIYQPGGAAIGNVNPDLQAIAAIARSLPVGVPKRIVFDGSLVADTIVAPTGAYDFGADATMYADPSKRTTLRFPEGATIATTVQTWDGGLAFEYLGTSAPCMTVVDGARPEWNLRGAVTMRSRGSKPIVSLRHAPSDAFRLNGADRAALLADAAAVFRLERDGALAEVVARGEFSAGDNTLCRDRIGAPSSAWSGQADDGATISVTQEGGPISIAAGSFAANQAFAPASSSDWDDLPPRDTNESSDRLAARRPIFVELGADAQTANTAFEDIPGLSLDVTTDPSNPLLDLDFRIDGSVAAATTIYFQLVVRTGSGVDQYIKGGRVTAGGASYGFSHARRKSYAPAPGVQHVRVQWKVAGSTVFCNASSDPDQYASLIVAKL